MIMDVYKRQVPLQSEIANPFSANKRQRKKSLLSTPSTTPDDISEWNSKNFVNYFANKYFEHFGVRYNKIYVSDCSDINEIFEFMEANDLDKNKSCKEFIDWSFENSQIVIARSGLFLLSVVKKYLNSYFQQAILDNREKAIQIDILDDIVALDQKGKAREVFASYGIPLAATYFVNHKKISTKNVISGLHQLFTTLLNGDFEQKKYVSKVIQRSISRGPYIEGFELLDWREIFDAVVQPYKSELWYKEKDFSGKPQYMLEKFLKEK